MRSAASARTRNPFVLIFVGVQLGMVLSTMVATIVATALPSIVDDLGGESSITWVVTAYLLAGVATMPLYGKLGDVYGRKRVYLMAIALFAIGSTLCGAAQNLPQLLGARALQGLGAGGLGPLAMAIVADLVPPRELGRWLGYQGAIFAVGGVAGPLLGGLFVDELSWRWAFLSNLPVAVTSFVIVAVALRVPYQRVAHSIDFRGSALLTGALALFVFLVTGGGNTFEWRSAATIGLAIAVVLLTVLFVRRERRAPEPFVPLRLFGNAVVRMSGALNLTSGLLFFCGIFFLPIFFQEVKGISPFESGVLLVPYMVTTALTTLLAGRRVAHTGRYRAWPILGAVLMTVGVGMLALIGEDTPALVAAMIAAVLGAGVGFVMQTSLLAVQNRVAQADLGIATGSALLGRTLGGTVGTALFGAVLAAGIPAASADAPNPPNALPAVFLSAVPFGLLALLAAWRLEEHPLGAEAHFSLDDTTTAPSA
jgi:EmrB/QacA subfamily drug resistance transporter